MNFPLNFDAIVFANGYVVIDAAFDVPDFWVEFGPDVGWGRFARESELANLGEARFVLREVRPAHEREPSPVVSSLGVLWRRRAACEAHQRIEIYRQAGTPAALSCPNSPCPHEDMRADVSCQAPLVSLVRTKGVDGLSCWHLQVSEMPAQGLDLELPTGCDPQLSETPSGRRFLSLRALHLSSAVPPASIPGREDRSSAQAKAADR